MIFSIFFAESSSVRALQAFNTTHTPTRTRKGTHVPSLSLPDTHQPIRSLSHSQRPLSLSLSLSLTRRSRLNLRPSLPHPQHSTPCLFGIFFSLDLESIFVPSAPVFESKSISFFFSNEATTTTKTTTTTTTTTTKTTTTTTTTNQSRTYTFYLLEKVFSL